jgi:hypothetical protein
MRTHILVLGCIAALAAVILLEKALLVPAAAAPPEPAPARIDFNREVRPLLSDKCFACHGPDAGQRQAKLRLDTRAEAFADRGGYQVIVPGDRSKSKLFQRINHEQAIARMPPPTADRQLDQQEVDLLGRWIDQGADWQTHWAYVSPKSPALPKVSDPDWPRNGIDNFILARLDREGLQASPAAAKSTLLRRVTLDLTGLPPTPEELDAFLADDSPEAYEERVDRLLESPHYGERMAMQWLDLARYADTHGFHIDSERHMWRWRDWVIDAFNRNMSFDQFTIEQLAGDLLPNPTKAQQIATGFNRNHMINFEGGAVPDEYQTEYVIDRLETTASVWMASTVGCSRCHDHKYDPFKQREFYQFYAFFNGLPEKGLDGVTGNAMPMLPLPSDDQQQRLEQLERDIAATEKKLPEDELSNLESDWRHNALATIPAPQDEGLVSHYEFETDLSDALDKNRGAKTVRGEVIFDAGQVHKAAGFSGETHATLGNSGDLDSGDEFAIAFWAKSASGTPMAILHKVEDAENRRGWEIAVDQAESIGDLKRGQHLIIRLVHHWPDDAIELKTSKRITQNDFHQISLNYDGSGKAGGLRLFVDGKIEPTEIVRDGLTGSIRTSAPLGSGDKKIGGPFKGSLDELRFYGRQISEDEIDRLATHHPVRALIAEPLEGCPEFAWREQGDDEDYRQGDKTAAEKKEDACRKRHGRLRSYYLTHVAPRRLRDSFQTLKKLDREKARLEKKIPNTMVMREAKNPRETFVLGRGDYRNKKEKVQPGVPAVLPPLPSDAPGNRLGLARWLVSPSHPLTARVTVNRYWQMYFGTGIVGTSEDFGSQGEAPSHPELLDWLAVEFVRSGWDVKAMQKLLVTSAAYRQSSKVTPELNEKDPGNRLLARGARFRLPAELIRDNALSLSGLLAKEIGGPSVFPYQPPGLWEDMSFGDIFSAQTYVTSTGQDLYRRSMYTFWKRTVPPAALATFDAPDREKCITRRARTNTPLQALALMNDTTYVEASRALAEKMIQAGGEDAEKRIEYAFRQATARRPSAEEKEVLLALANEQLEDYRRDPDAAKGLLGVGDSSYDSTLDPAEFAAWATVASTILNLDETITKE